MQSVLQQLFEYFGRFSMSNKNGDVGVKNMPDKVYQFGNNKFIMEIHRSTWDILCTLCDVNRFIYLTCGEYYH